MVWKLIALDSKRLLSIGYFLSRAKPNSNENTPARITPTGGKIRPAPMLMLKAPST
jgi:hypothetical protein